MMASARVCAVLDTNVLASSLISPHSPPGRITDAALNGALGAVINNSILQEYCNVLFRQKFQKYYCAELAAALLRNLFDASARYEPLALPPGLHMPDADDIVFYATALASRAAGNTTYLVTGNLKHFPPDDFIVSPRTLLDVLGLAV